MLFNQMGIEDDDNIVDLDERRGPVDAKARVTMTVVLQTALTTNEVAPLAPPPLAERPVTRLAAALADDRAPRSGSQADVA